MRRSLLIGIGFWALLFGGLALPAFFNVGYGLFDLETWILAIACVIAAFIAQWALPFGSRLSGGAAAFLLLAYVELYIPILFLSSSVLLVLVLLASIALGFKFPRPVAVVVLATMAAGLIGSYFEIPPALVTKISQTVPSTNSPSVIHILVDEHASNWGFPHDVIAQSDLDRMWNRYLERGFVVFDRSYALNRYTFQSVARFFNPRKHNFGDTFQRVDDNYQINSAAALDRIAQTRALDVTSTEFVDLDPVLRDIKKVAYFATYEPIIGGSAAGRLGAKPVDRMIVAAGVSWGWLYAKQKSPIARWITSHSNLFQRLYGTRWRVVAPNSVLIGENFARRMRDAKRGRYYFLHLLLPHSQYVLDENCTPRYWHLPPLQPGSGLIPARAEVYRRYFQQVQCAQKTVLSILDAIEANPLLADATIIIHGDHGSRINVPTLDDWLATGRGRDEFERDWRAAFMAVRVPSIAAKRIDRPAEITEVYRHLLDSNFRAIDVEHLEETDPVLIGACASAC